MVPTNYPHELKLLYRASRDGWYPDKFRAACGAAAPTISLFRVMTQATGRSYAIIGGFSTVSFAPPPPEGGESHASARVSSPVAFVFQLKDGNAGSSASSFQPTKWRARSDRRASQTIGPRMAINYGPSALRLMSTSGTIATRNKPFVIPDGSPFLALSGWRATEIEVFELNEEAADTPRPAKRSRRSTGIGFVDDTTIDPPKPMTAQKVCDDLHHFGALVAGPLREEQTALFHARTELVQASNCAAASAKALEFLYGPEVAAGEKDEVVELSVRGIRMTTLRSTLRACPESTLAARFDPEKWAPTDKDLDEHGRVVVDCRPSCFSEVLDVLRMRKRAAWAGGDWKQRWGDVTRVGIKAADRREFEQFVHYNFPGCERFVMDCVETREESSLWREKEKERSSFASVSEPTKFATSLRSQKARSVGSSQSVDTLIMSFTSRIQQQRSSLKQDTAGTPFFETYTWYQGVLFRAPQELTRPTNILSFQLCCVVSSCTGFAFCRLEAARSLLEGKEADTNGYL